MLLDPPSKPEVTNVTRTTVSLKWSSPLNDGGSPIVGYIIERKPYTLTGEGRWLKCNYTNVTETFYTVTALGEGEPYEFRIIAKNANQVFSRPSETTGSVQCKTDFGNVCISDWYTVPSIQLIFTLLTMFILSTQQSLQRPSWIVNSCLKL